MNTNLPHPPVNDMTPDQYAAFENLPDAIVEWLEFLQSLDFEADAVATYIAPEGFQHYDNFTLSNELQMQYSPETAPDENLLFFGAGFANLYQFLEGTMWPDIFGDHSSQPVFLRAAFFTEDRATITMGGYAGEPLFDNDVYQLDDEGPFLTWDEAGKMLIAIRKEMARNLKMQGPPPVTFWQKLGSYLASVFAQ